MYRAREAMGLLLLLVLQGSCVTTAAEPATPSILEPNSHLALTLTQTASASTEMDSTSILPSPSDEPVAVWEGIPVMLDAIAGSGGENSYIFSVHASANDVQLFYEKEMTGLGWSLFAIGQGGVDTVMLMFMKDGDMLTVSILPQSNGIIFVMFVK